MKLTELEAYKAMIAFLDLYYQKTQSDDIGGFLGGMDLIKPGKTMDSACWFEWMRCINEIKGKAFITNLTELEAYKAMIDFLVVYSQEIKSNDLGCVLSGMVITADKQKTMDPYAWQDWINSINKVKGKESITNLTELEAYSAMIKFLEIYYMNTNSKDVGDLLSAMKLTGDEKITKNPEAWQNWIRSVEKVLSEKSN
jgi:hypothetical protein